MTTQSPPWPPPIVSSVITMPASNTAYWRSPISGTMQNSVRPGARFEFEVTGQLLDEQRLRQWLAFMAYVQDEGLPFYWNHYPKGRPFNYPQGTDAGGTPPWGSPVVAGANQTGRSLAVSGLTAGAAFVAGDCLAFDNGVYREMHIIKSDTTAADDGTATFPIVPTIRNSPADGAVVLFDGNASDVTKRCACEVIVPDGQQAKWSLQGFQMSSTFKLVEFVR